MQNYCYLISFSVGSYHSNQIFKGRSQFFCAFWNMTGSICCISRQVDQFTEQLTSSFLSYYCVRCEYYVSRSSTKHIYSHVLLVMRQYCLLLLTLRSYRCSVDSSLRFKRSIYISFNFNSTLIYKPSSSSLCFVNATTTRVSLQCTSSIHDLT